MLFRSKDSAFPGVLTWVCQAAGEGSDNGGGLYCGTILANPSVITMKTSGRGVDVALSLAAGVRPGGGSSGGPWFYDNIGLGIHQGTDDPNGVWVAYFERIEPVFSQLKTVSSTTKLYCESSWLPGVTVACTP